MIFKEKYLKYKKKYLEIKKIYLAGGSDITKCPNLEIGEYYIKRATPSQYIYIGKLVNKELVDGKCRCLFKKTIKDNEISENITNDDSISYVVLKIKINNSEFLNLQEELKEYYIVNSDYNNTQSQINRSDQFNYSLKHYVDDIKELSTLIEKETLKQAEYKIVQQYGTLEDKSKIITIPGGTLSLGIRHTLYKNKDKYIKSFKDNNEIVNFEYNLLSEEEKKLYIRSRRDKYISIYKFFKMNEIDNNIRIDLEGTIYSKCIMEYTIVNVNRKIYINIFSKESLKNAKNKVDHIKKTNLFLFDSQKENYNKLIKSRNELLRRNNETLIKNLTELGLFTSINFDIMPEYDNK
jgi:hypothetical protein